ncbi:hypothetical protein KIPB_014846, partial [Kipferlia bialata]
HMSNVFSFGRKPKPKPSATKSPYVSRPSSGVRPVGSPQLSIGQSPASRARARATLQHQQGEREVLDSVNNTFNETLERGRRQNDTTYI